MPTKLVNITGVMTWEDTEAPKPPLGIWGPTDPRPTQPIAFPIPPNPSQPPPLGIWGPTDPFPTNPIQLPPWAGKPQPPFPNTPPPPGQAGQLPGSDPSGSGWVYAYVPGYGWMWAKVPSSAPETPPAVPEVNPLT